MQSVQKFGWVLACPVFHAWKMPGTDQRPPSIANQFPDRWIEHPYRTVQAKEFVTLHNGQPKNPQHGEPDGKESQARRGNLQGRLPEAGGQMPQKYTSPH